MPTGRILRVTHQGAAPVAKSVHDCPVGLRLGLGGFDDVTGVREDFCFHAMDLE